MKALTKYGNGMQFGGYKYQDMPEPVCGDDDVIIELKASAICGADLKHYGVDNGSTEFDSIRGHEFAGIIAETGKNVVDWKVGQRVVSDNTGYVCGKCPACERGDFLLCSEKVNLGLGMNGGFTKYCKIPGELLKIHKRAIWEIPDHISYEAAAIMDPVCNGYKAVAQRSSLLPGENVVVYGMGPLGLNCMKIAQLMGAAEIIGVGVTADEKYRFDIARKFGATVLINGDKSDVPSEVQKICGKDGLGLVVDCAGVGSVLKEGIEILRPNGEYVRVGMGYKPLDFSINEISMKAINIIGHQAYDTTTWRNAMNLLDKGMIHPEDMITHRLGLSQWEEGFQKMISKEATKVILTYDGD